MTAPRLTPVLVLAGLLLAAWAATAFASVPYPQGPQGPLGPPMQMPMKVGPKKCAPPPCGPPACAPVSFAPLPCPPPACPPPDCAPPGCAPPPCGSMQFAGCGSGGMDGVRGTLGQVLGIIALPFTLLEKMICSEPKHCPPECPPVMCCAPPPCGPMAYGPPVPPTKARRVRPY
jgi:hypothetical protein